MFLEVVRRPPDRSNRLCVSMRNVLVSHRFMRRVRLADVVRELPRRAHDLSRREVEESQRWRMLEAVTDVTAKHGYADAAVADIIAAAGLSRKTFYEQFKDKEECFLTAYDVVSKRL